MLNSKMGWKQPTLRALKSPWAVASAVIVVAVLITAAFAAFGPTKAVPAAPGVIKAQGTLKSSTTTAMQGQSRVMANMPTRAANTQASAPRVTPERDILTEAARDKQKADAEHLSGMPALSGGSVARVRAAAQGTSQTPSFAIAPLAKNYEGLNATQSGCNCEPPDMALTSGEGWILQAVNGALGLYNTNGVLLKGPISDTTFFASVMHPGGELSDPRLHYDNEHARFIMVEAEFHTCGACVQKVDGSWYDIAVSKTPDPSGAWWFYSFDTNTHQTANGDDADFPEFGFNQNGIWLTGATFDNLTAVFVGNVTFVVPVVPALGGVLSGVFSFDNTPTGISAPAGGFRPAFRVSPALEVGNPEAEWMLATDAGYGGPYSDVTLVSFTNLSGLNATPPVAPTSKWIISTVPQTYADPPSAVQPGSTTTLDTGTAGPAQLQYISGHLLTAWSSAVNWVGDPTTRAGAYWLDITPTLTSGPAPRQVSGFTINSANIFGYAGAYVFYPTLFSSSELDEVLAFDYTSPGDAGLAPAAFPSIMYTSRQGDDQPNLMAQDNATVQLVVAGARPYVDPFGSTVARWGDYTACMAMPFQVYNWDGVRGNIWCGGQYSGSAATWQTRYFVVKTQ